MAQSQLMQEALVFVERINLLRFLENSQPRFRSNVDRKLCNKFDGSGAWEKPRTGESEPSPFSAPSILRPGHA